MVLFAAALVLTFLGIWSYQAEQERAWRSLGETVAVVVAARPLPAWAPLAAGDLAVRPVPRRFAGPGHLASPAHLIGRMPVVAIPEGAPVPAYALYAGPELRQGELAWELRPSPNLILDARLRPGDRVAVLAAGGKGGQEAVRQVLAGARVLAVRQSEEEIAATLAVTLEQGKALMEAENFARQMRVVLDPLPGAAGAGGES